MVDLLLAISAFSAFAWITVLLLPWRPWLNDETLEPDSSASGDLSDLTVLIPARNEAEVIALTLRGIAEQGRGVKVVLVDDGSEDGTAQIARRVEGIDLTVIEGQPLPPGWSGKLWALEQGSREITTTWTLLLDADIRLLPGMAAALLDKARKDNRQFVSIMASLRMESFWEKFLMPAFIFFFKLLYPFRLANSKIPYFAAAAGGCILLETRLIAEIGGFSIIRQAIIDDCSLAKRIKQAGYRIWIGQSRSVISLRRYERLESIWEMVARTAFTQLRYSALLLALCTLLMMSLFLAPLVAIIWADEMIQAWSLTAYSCMVAVYRPILRYYDRSRSWALILPLIGSFYLAMTWTSALRYWRGERSRWKNRVYSKEETI